MSEFDTTSGGRLAWLLSEGSRLRRDGNPTAAEPLLREAVTLAEQDSHDQPARIACSLNALGLLCKDLARYDEASALYERALDLLQSVASGHAPDFATLYHNLAGIEHARRNYAAGEPLARKGLEMRRWIGRDDDAALAADLVALAAILDGQRKFDEAESLYLDALRILEASPNANAAEIGVALNDLGAQYVERGRFDRAEELLVRASDLKARRLGARHPDVAVSLNNLATLHERRGDTDRASALFGEALQIVESALGPNHPKTVDCRRNYERCLAVNSRM